MDGLGAAASVIAVVEIAAKVASLCLEYSSAVKNAKPDIERLRRHNGSLKMALEGAQQLPNSPDGARLRNSQQCRDALDNTSLQLDRVRARPEDKLNKGQAMRRVGLRSLWWPFESKDIDKIIAALQRDQDTLSASLHIDQTARVLDIDRKIDFSKLPVARGAAFDSQATCLHLHPGLRCELRLDLGLWNVSLRYKAWYARCALFSY
ncbi:hypothetical protein F5883DRAFT_140510 [Diaporthe sp. PMI_573]|nr:hypothetical protein F5883DRAFT_140510 [Diaporthaceae sp. PMI_573]